MWYECIKIQKGCSFYQIVFTKCFVIRENAFLVFLYFVIFVQGFFALGGHCNYSLFMKVTELIFCTQTTTAVKTVK